MAALGGYVGSANDAARIQALEKERTASKAAFDAAKAKPDEAALKSRLVGFAASASEQVEAAFKDTTVGLQTQAQFAEKRANVERELEKERAAAARSSEAAQLAASARKRATAQAAAAARLSFAADVEEEEEAAAAATADGVSGGAAKRARLAGAPSSFAKCPEVETGFLPDRERERAEAAERAALAEEWASRQALLRSQPLELAFSFYDGRGHRSKAVVRRGDTVAAVCVLFPFPSSPIVFPSCPNSDGAFPQFLRAARDALEAEPRLGGAPVPAAASGGVKRKGATAALTTADGLLFVKEDVILPHTLTFHELICAGAKGRAGNLMFQLETGSSFFPDAPSGDEGGGAVRFGLGFSILGGGGNRNSIAHAACASVGAGWGRRGKGED